ncbi:hypothetical protein [Oryza sativa Japonica Group]|jgi:hypothetical protein|uniref:Uncharacterized protein n=1 Tax=Oryza sativa subsp. japonica TaxID=39947 RepID=Q5VPN4_ORYSJ|nr:hypothetical protein OsJ_02773 [Oryza sativa Japonica Group]BAD68591.1 hypothetical protein [Oryza sativa Japonica Group]
MAGASGERPASNWDWSDYDAAFTEEADGAIAALQDTGGDGLATKQLLERYHASPLAHTILAQWYFAHADQQKPTNHLRRAAWMAPRCLHIAFALALVLIEMGSFDEADMVCAHSLLVPDLTDPVHNFISPKEQVDAIITSKAPEYRLGRGAIWAF